MSYDMEMSLGWAGGWRRCGGVLEVTSYGGGVAAVAGEAEHGGCTHRAGGSISAVSARPRHLQHTIAKQAAASIVWTQSVQVHSNVTT